MDINKFNKKSNQISLNNINKNILNQILNNQIKDKSKITIKFN